MTLDELAARRPRAEYDAVLPARALDEFTELGFTVLDRISTDEEVAWLADVHEALLEASTHMRGGYIKDVINPVDLPRADAPSQFIMPELRYSPLMETNFWRNGRILAARLLRIDPERLDGWGHIVRKPPQGTDPVHWHQDEGYWDPSFDYTALGCWMPLDAATVESGCMRFIPGSHRRDIRKHRFLNDDPKGTSLVVDAIDETQAIPAPVPIGGASFHHCRVLHASGPNLTYSMRRAHICEWQLPPVRRDAPSDRPWVIEGQRAKQAALSRQA